MIALSATKIYNLPDWKI